MPACMKEFILGNYFQRRQGVNKALWCWLICYCQLSPLSTCRLRSSRAACTFIYRALASPASTSGIRMGPGRKSFCAHRILNSPGPGQWRLANVKSGRLPRFNQRMDHEMSVDSTPRGLKLKKNKIGESRLFNGDVVSPLNILALSRVLEASPRLWVQRSLHGSHFLGSGMTIWPRLNREKSMGKGIPLLHAWCKWFPYQFRKGSGWGLEDSI